MGHLLLVFLDGVGIGTPDPARNPFLSASIPTWRALAGGRWPTLADPAPRRTAHATLLPADATLGVPGVPQSGTGTTALLTGQNAPAHLGRHAGPFPPRALHPLLHEHNLLSQAVRRGHRATFATAFPPFFFERLARGKARRTTCTQAALAAGLPLRTHADLCTGRALSSWITNEHWQRFDPTVPAVTPFQAGEQLARLALAHEVTLFEYFHTDHRGHRPSLPKATATLALLDDFLAGLLVTLDPARDLLVMASDHGNFEEQGHSEHTINPTLVTLWGARQAEVAARIQRTTDLVPALMAWLAP